MGDGNDSFPEGNPTGVDKVSVYLSGPVPVTGLVSFLIDGVYFQKRKCDFTQTLTAFKNLQLVLSSQKQKKLNQ